MKLKDLHAGARLQEVYMLWHKSAEAYESPDEFRTYLNACIQAIRNVTFVLQKQKSEIDKFDEWYSKWQEALKNDQIMKWCVQARNQIVKIGDLEKHSLAIVSYVASYFEAPKHKFKVNPFSTTTEIAHDITINLLPTELRDSGFLKIERRWVSIDFPEIELLEVLAYAFSVLTQMLSDLEKREGPYLKSLKNNLENEFTKCTETFQINKSELPLCMTSFEGYRTKWLKLPNLEITQAEVVSHKTKEVSKEKVIKRYGELPTLSKSESEGLSNLRKQVFLFVKQAKLNLKKDKHLVPVVFLMNENNMSIIKIEYENYEDKYLVWESIAKEVELKHATSIITIGEMWSTPLDLENPKMRSHESPERSELIHVAAISKEGESFAISVPFFRRWRKIHFKKEIIYEVYAPNYLKPVQRVWANQLS